MDKMNDENREKEFTPHEKELMGKMAPHLKALMTKLTAKERESLEQNVNSENIDIIQTWIGSYDDIERILYWSKGGKFDDPEWDQLKPCDKTNRLLFEEAKKHYGQLREEAVETQARSDLTLLSQFNGSLLFTGLAGAVRCDERGEPDEQGGFFKGVEFRLIGSVEECINNVIIYPLGSGEFEVHFGSRLNDSPSGISVYSGDSFALTQLKRLVEKDLPKLGFESEFNDLDGNSITIDIKAVRKSAKKGEPVGYPGELLLFSSARTGSMGNAMELADNLSRLLYERFSLEIECYKLRKICNNFFIMRNDNFDRLLPETPVNNRGLVMFTTTFDCRRCRRELEAFRTLAETYSDISFAIVNLVSPQFKFYERVFTDMGGGDPDEFRDNPKGSTPFVIVYVPDDKGVLQFAEYYGTEKAEAPPSSADCIALLDKYFNSLLSKIDIL